MVGPARSPGAGAGDTTIAGRYRLEASLGEGGMATVHAAFDESTGRRVALKLGREPHELTLAREFHTLVRLRHPRVVEAYEFGIDRRRGPFYTMELLGGQDAAALGAVGWKQACAILCDVASALALVHSKGLVHCDVAAGNVRCADGIAKLTDFGLIATTGLVRDVAGTPPYLAPEVVHGLPLDPRVDLFSLGGLAYRLLTGSHAYPGRAFGELEELWRHPPAPPSSVAAGTPAALDELVLRLLSIEPLARPSVVEVIDRMRALADLQPAPELEIARGYLSSSALVGRAQEIGDVRADVAKAADGAGRAIVFQGPSGIGKSRLLREIMWEAQVAGATVVSVDSEAAGRGPYGVLNELVQAVGKRLPGASVDLARARAARVGNLAEDRARLQTELCAWLLAAADACRPLVLLVDEMQRCDEGSAAVLAALARAARSHRLLLAFALRTDEAPQARAALAAVGSVARTVDLAGLTPAEVEELVRGLFGPVPNPQRFAHWLAKAAGDNTLHCIELMRQLVDDEQIRYLDGMWVIPEDLGSWPVPSGMRGALDALVARLRPSTRTLAESLSVAGGELTLVLCAKLAGGLDQDGLFSALDELAYEHILVGSAGHYRFRHDALREALLGRLDAARRREVHLGVARALAGEGAIEAGRAAEVGRHFLLGGEALRGAELLERAGRQLIEMQSFWDAIEPLESALAVYQRDRRHRWRCLELQLMLVQAASLADREVALRHGDALLLEYWQRSGLARSARVSRILGSRLAVAFGMGTAFARWLLTLGAGPSPLEALRCFCTVAGLLATVFSVCRDLGGLARLVDMSRPLGALRGRIPSAAHHLVRSNLALPVADIPTLLECERLVLEALALDRLTPISDLDRRLCEATILVNACYGLIYCGESDRALADRWARIAELDLRMLEPFMIETRVIYHRCRGEEDLARAAEAHAEALSLQIGAVWMVDAGLASISALGYVATSDVVGLKRIIERLERLVAAGYGFQNYLDLARGAYHRERAEYEQSKAALERALARRWPGDFMTREWALAGLAETLVAAGDHEAAMRVAQEGLDYCRSPARRSGAVRCGRALALTAAATGNSDGASRRLDELIAKTAPLDHTLLCGMLHEARASVALGQGDHLQFVLHLREMERYFRLTQNPVLLARIDRLARAERDSAASRRATGSDGERDETLPLRR